MKGVIIDKTTRKIEKKFDFLKSNHSDDEERKTLDSEEAIIESLKKTYPSQKYDVIFEKDLDQKIENLTAEHKVSGKHTTERIKKQPVFRYYLKNKVSVGDREFAGKGKTLNFPRKLTKSEKQNLETKLDMKIISEIKDTSYFGDPPKGLLDDTSN